MAASPTHARAWYPPTSDRAPCRIRLLPSTRETFANPSVSCGAAVPFVPIALVDYLSKVGSRNPGFDRVDAEKRLRAALADQRRRTMPAWRDDLGHRIRGGWKCLLLVY